MSLAVTYTCDQCQQRIGELYGPLFVTVSAPSEPSLDRDAHFCSLDHFADWAANLARPKFELRRKASVDPTPSKLDCPK